MTLKQMYRPMKKAVAAVLSVALVLSALVTGGVKLTPVRAATGPADRTNLVSPAYRADLVTDSVTVTFSNQSGASAKVYSQKQPDDTGIIDTNGTKALVAEVTMSGGQGSFVFPAADYPFGPIAIRVDVYDANAKFIDTAYFQFYNKVGVEWKTGLGNAPENPVTDRMQVTFADDFNAMPNLTVKGQGMGSSSDNSALAPSDAHSYATRKVDSTGGDNGGMFGWGYFADHDNSAFDPFKMADNQYIDLKTTYYPEDGAVPWAGTYWDQKVGAGYLSSMGMDGSGFHTSGGHNQYFECRMFTGPNPALWPAFWLLTSNGAQYSDGTLAPKYGGPSDEIDINESYLGSPDGYQTTGHQWGYSTGLSKGQWNVIDAPEWSNINIAMGFHTFGCLITENTTYYYCDNVEVFSHPTLPVSWEQGNYFIINSGVSDHYGIPQRGKDTFGPDSQPIGFTRYGNECDTYVDWVRVYEDTDNTPRFELVKSQIAGLPDDFVSVQIKRNAAAQALEGIYQITLPGEGWKVLDGSNFTDVSGTQTSVYFAPGSAEDDILLLTPGVQLAQGSKISVIPLANDVWYTPAMTVNLIVEGERGTQVDVNSSTYPYRGKGGETSGAWSNYDPSANEKQYFNFISGGWWNEGWSWMHERSGNAGELTFSFTGNAFELSAIKWASGWPFDIWMDSEAKTRIDTTAPADTTEVVYSWSDPSGVDKAHVVHIKLAPNAPDNDHHTRLADFTYWYHEDTSIPKYTLAETYFGASNDAGAVIKPGGIIDIHVNRNAATASTFGTYGVTFPDYGAQGYKLISADSLNNRAQDTIRLQLPSDPSWLGKVDTISITAPAGSGFTKTLTLTVQSPDPLDAPAITGDHIVKVNAQTYPYVNILPEGGGGAWFNGWNGSSFDKTTQDFDYFTFNGGWWSDGWGWMYTNANDGQYVDFTFAGDAVAMYAEYHSMGAPFDVYLDGKLQGSYSSKGNTPSLRVFSASGLTAAEHTLRVMTRGAGYMKITGFDYNYIASAEQPKRVDVNSSTYPGSGSWGGFVQPPVNYFTNINGGWWCDSWGWMYVHANSSSSIDFNFTGNEVWAYGRTYDTAGRANFYIDGVYYGTFDSSIAPANMVEYFHASGLLPAAHVLTVKTINDGRAGDFILSGFSYMATPASQSVKFSLDKTAVSTAAGASFAVTVKPSATADTYAVSYAVTVPDGWTYSPTNLSFAPGAGSQTITFTVPENEFAAQRDVTIQPSIGAYKAPAMSVKAKMAKSTPPDIVSLVSPDYRSELNGQASLLVAAPGGYVTAKAMFTHAPDAAHPNEHGYTYVIGPVSLDANGRGTIAVNSDIMPNGPVMIRVVAYKPDGKTSCDGYFQFYNRSGEKWNAGMSGYNAAVPGKYDAGAALPAAINDIQSSLGKAPLEAVFADDFTYANAAAITDAISHDGLNKTYAAHYPNGMDDRGYFAGPEVGAKYGQIYNPFRAVDGQYLEMITQRYDTTLSGTALSWAPYANYYQYTSGCISSVNEQGHSPKKLPDYPNWDGWTDGNTEQYLEARIFFGPNPGEWPAFWTLSNMSYLDPATGAWRDGGKSGWYGTDELDICEGWMPATGYSVNTHQWSYSTGKGGNIGGVNGMDVIAKSAPDADPNVGNFSMGWHTYGCYITKATTYYFFDGIMVGSEETLDLSWRDGNRFLINSGVAQDKEKSLPEGYGFTRYGDASNMYVDWVRIWETPIDAQKPIFNLNHDSLILQSVTPGQNLTFKIDRMNSAAAAMSGTYQLDMPAGWTVVSGANFAAGTAASATDTVVVNVPASYVNYSAKVGVTPTVSGSAVADTMYVQTQNTDNSFNVSIYPVYNKAGGWNINVEMANASDYAISGGTVLLKFPDGHSQSISFADVPAHGSQTVVFQDAPININNLQDFVFHIARADGYQRDIDRPVSSLTATPASGIDITKQFDANDWAGAMKVRLSGESVKNKVWLGDDDLSVDQYVKYDAANLYIAEIVKDDVAFFGTGDFGGLWNYDSIQLSFDATRAAGFAPDKDHIRLTGGLTASLAGGLANETFLYNNKTVSDIKTNFYRDENAKTTVYLLAIPWAAILPDGKPVADKTDLGFTMLINDNDNKGGRGWISYMYGIATGKNPAQFGDLILTGDPAVDVTKTAVGVTAANTKTVYGIDEDFDYSALTVKLNYSDGSYDVLTPGEYTLNGFVKGQTGRQTLSVTCVSGGATFTGSPFTITVAAGDAKTATALAVVSYPSKLAGYAPYEPLDPTGLALKVVYSDGSSENVVSGYTVDFDSSTGGVKLVTISYMGLDATFNAVVDGSLAPYADPVRIWVDKAASTLLYRLGEPLNITVKADYDDGNGGIITGTLSVGKYRVDGYDAYTGGTQDLTITYINPVDPQAIVAPAEVRVLVSGAVGIAYVSGPSKTKYHVGETLNTAGLVVNLEYEVTSLNRPITVTSDMLSGDLDFSTAGTKTIYVAYDGYETSFQVTVNAMIGLKVVSPAKTAYYVGDTLDQTGMQVYEVYGANDEVRVTGGYTVTPTLLDTAGANVPVVVSYKGFSVTFSVSVETRPQITRIEITTPPTRTNYYVAEKLNTAGMVVSAVYDKNPIGSSTNVAVLPASAYSVTYSFTNNPMPNEITTAFWAIGEFTIEVTYKADTSMTATGGPFNVEAAPALTNITVTPPTKTRYYVGDPLDTAGMVVTAVYDKPLTYGGTNYTQRLSLSEVDITPQTFTAAGDPVEVTVTLNRPSVTTYSATFNVTVLDRETLYVDFDWTKNGVQGAADNGSFLPDTNGIRASSSYPYSGNTLRLWTDTITNPNDSNGYGHAVTYDGVPGYEIFKNANNHNWVMFSFNSDIKTRSWYNPDGMWLTFSVKYYAVTNTGGAAVQYYPVGSNWNYAYDNWNTPNYRLDLKTTGEWKTQTFTVWLVPGKSDYNSDFMFSFGGPATVAFNYLTVSPATDEEIAASHVVTGIQIQKNATKTQYAVGEAFTPGSTATGIGDMTVWALYADGTHTVLLNNMWGWLTQYTATGFDSSKDGVCTVTAHFYGFSDTIEMTIGAGAPQPVTTVIDRSNYPNADGSNWGLGGWSGITQPKNYLSNFVGNWWNDGWGWLYVKGTNQSLDFNFYGYEVWFNVGRYANGGAGDVYLDGLKVGSYDTQNATQDIVEAFRIGNLTDGPHKLTITVTRNAEDTKIEGFGFKTMQKAVIPTGVSVAKAPQKTYLINEMPDDVLTPGYVNLNGLALSVNYSDGSFNQVTYDGSNVSVSGVQNLGGGSFRVTVAYGSLTATYDAAVTDRLNAQTYPTLKNGGWSGGIQNGPYFTNIVGGWWNDSWGWNYTNAGGGGQSFDFNFIGTEAWVNASLLGNGATASIYVDGVKAKDVSTVGDNWNGVEIYRAAGLAYGPHVLSVRIDNGQPDKTLRLTEFGVVKYTPIAPPKPDYVKLKVWYDGNGEHDEGLHFSGYPASFQSSLLSTKDGYTGVLIGGDSQWLVSDPSLYSDDVIKNATITLEFYDSGILSTDTDTYIRCSVPGNVLYGDSFGKISDIGPGPRTVVYVHDILLNKNVYDWNGTHTGKDFQFYTRGRTILLKSITIEWGTPPVAAVDKTALDALIADTEASLANGSYDGYTAASVASAQSALDAAKAVSDDSGATQNDVDNARADLAAAVGALAPATLACGVQAMLLDIGVSQMIPYTWDGYGALEFVSSDPAVCDVAPDGTLSPMAAGTAVITISAPNGSSATVNVTVKADKTALDALIAEAEAGLAGNAYANSTADSVAALRAALLAAQQVSADDYATQAAVDAARAALADALATVKTSPAKLDCAVKSMAAKIAKPLQIPYVWNGSGALQFTSSNTAVCGVSQSGVLSPLKAGTAVITITTPDNTKYVFAVTVTA